jgi:hypothetical protein
MTTDKWRTARMVVAFMVAAFLTATSAGAQELATNFDQLRVLVAPGQTVTVTDLTGREVKGQIVRLTASTIALLVKGASVEFRDSDVTQMRQRRPDSLANGAKTGFYIGSGLGLLAGLAIAGDDDVDAAPLAVFAVLTYGGIGAGIGAGIDAMIEGDRPIYSRTSGTPGRFALRPIAGHGRRGVSLAFRF